MSSKSRKLSLIGTIFVSMLSICSAAVSTFAWFQANANVNVQTSSTSTSISVSKGLDWTFYVYNGNFVDFNVNNDLVGYTTAPTNTTGTFASDFSEINSSTGVSPSKASNTTNMWPGEKLAYAIKITGATNNKIAMYLKSYTSTKANGTYKSYIKGATNTIVDMAMAIDIYSISSTNGTGYYDATSSSTRASSFLNKDATNGSLNDKFNFPTVSSYENSNPLFSSNTSSDFSNGTIYIFFTIMYSNLQKDLYKEVTQNADSEIEPASGVDRFFKHFETGGYSNCFQGLSFQIGNLELTNA